MGNWTYSPIEIKFAILAHFTTLYTSKALYTPIIMPNPWNLHPITSHILDSILGDVTDGEVKDACSRSSPPKCQAPRFQLDFLPNALGHFGAFLHQLHRGGFYDKKNSRGLELNPYLLMPKVDKPETVHQFQSINLCNTLYKAVTKILVQRLKP